MGPAGEEEAALGRGPSGHKGVRSRGGCTVRLETDEAEGVCWLCVNMFRSADCMTILRLQRDKSDDRETIALFPRTPHTRAEVPGVTMTVLTREGSTGGKRGTHRALCSCLQLRETLNHFQGTRVKPTGALAASLGYWDSVGPAGPVPSAALTIRRGLVAVLSALLGLRVHSVVSGRAVTHDQDAASEGHDTRPFHGAMFTL